ncbi:MAG: tRNA (adenosine(37)-N6)-threonylcarbamoyltransferase complex dimerization subunit type 1 TsaB [Planctomycetota bacterium]|nr:tRNA (adenosine(37)-N6)-threonylcarbamoyltransferase complex dimerization subunit type 1 TsaB [Planctomycetota bacterium]
MIVLAIETAGPVGGVAIIASGRLTSKIEFQTQGQLGARLTPAIDKVMKEAGLSHDVPPDMITVDIGPGSYTGIRVGLAAAKGLAFGWQRPLVGVSSMNALAEEAPEGSEKVVTVIDARKGEVYASIFDRVKDPATNLMAWRLVFSPGIISPVKLAEKIGDDQVTLVGNAANTIRQVFGKNAKNVEVVDTQVWPDVEKIGQLGSRLYQRGRLDDALSLTPVYMRPTAPEMATGRKRKRSTSKI